MSFNVKLKSQVKAQKHGKHTSLSINDAKAAPHRGSVEKSRVVSAADNDLSATVSIYIVSAVVISPVHARDPKMEGFVTHSMT